MATNAQVSMQVRRFAAMSLLVAGAFALQVAFADHYVVAPMMEVVGCMQARAPATTQVSARPHFEEEIIVVAPARRGAGSHKAAGGGGHASRTGEAALLQAVDRDCGAAAPQAAL
jgi:hypothetical protein